MAIQSTDSITSLEGLSASEGDIAIVTSYAIPGDGGGGTFVLEAAEPDALVIASEAFTIELVSTEAGQMVPVEEVRPTIDGGGAQAEPTVVKSTGHPFWTGQEVQLSGVVLHAELTASTASASLTVDASAGFKAYDRIRISEPDGEADNIAYAIVTAVPNATTLSLDTSVAFDDGALVEYVERFNGVNSVTGGHLDYRGHATFLRTTLTANATASPDVLVANIMGFRVGDTIRIRAPGAAIQRAMIEAIVRGPDLLTPQALPAGQLTLSASVTASTDDRLEYDASPLANRVWRITVVDADHFSLDDSPVMVGLAGGTATGLSVQVTSDGNHPFETGQAVGIDGLTGDTSGEGQWLVTKVTDTTFLLNDSLGTGSSTGGTAASTLVTTDDPHRLRPGRRVRIAGTGITELDELWPLVGVRDPLLGDAAIFSLPTDSTGNATAGVVGDGALFVASSDDPTLRWRRLFSGPIDVRWFGVNIEATTAPAQWDNAQAFSAAFHAVATGDPWNGFYDAEGYPSATLFFDSVAGRYDFARPDNRTSCVRFDTIGGVVLKGPGHLHFAGAASYPEGGSSSFIELRGAFRITFEDLNFTYADAGYEGALISTHSGTKFANDPSALRFQRCNFAGIGVDNASSFLALDHLICSSIRDCSFTAANIGIRGGTTSNSTNSLIIEGNIFNKLGSCSVYNGCEAWVIAGNTFEPTADHASRSAYDQSLDYYAYAINFVGNWIGDGGIGGTWLTMKTLGANIIGNTITNNAGDSAIKIAGSNGGIHVAGNNLGGPIEFIRDRYGLANSGTAVIANSAGEDLFRGSEVPEPLVGNHFAIGNVNNSTNRVPSPVVQSVAFRIYETQDEWLSSTKIPGNATILDVTVRVVTPFYAGDPMAPVPVTIDLGYEGVPTYIQTMTDPEPQTAGVYVSPHRLSWLSTGAPVLATINNRDPMVTTGEALVVVQYILEY